MQIKIPMAARKSYIKEFKLKAIRLANEQDVAKKSWDLDIGENLIYCLQEEVAILKKSVAIFSSRPK